MLGQFDVSVFHFINANMANPIFDFLMPLITSIGSGEFLFALAMGIMVFAPKDKKIAGIYILAGLTVTYYAVDVLKGATAIPRPYIALADARLIVPKVGGGSFPSGHTAMAFLAATVLAKYFGHVYALFAIAAAVAFSRIYIGVHYLSDVISGAPLGIIIGLALFIISGENRSTSDA